MTDQPTPETDDQPIILALNYNGYAVPSVDIEFARKLERERDEARDMVKRLCKSQFGTNCEFLPMEDEE